MLSRILEPEVMDTPEEARDYDAMDHSHVNRVFVADLLAFFPLTSKNLILDVGTGTAQIPIELCRQVPNAHIVAIDLAEHMLQVARENVKRAGLENNIKLERVDAKGLPSGAGLFDAVISNSIAHHIPEPINALAEMVRAARTAGGLFIRDLLRPETNAAVKHLVQTYAGDANAHQQKMFDDSLRAALTLDEIQALVARLGFDPATVRQTTDRHWTWSAHKK